MGAFVKCNPAQTRAPVRNTKALLRSAAALLMLGVPSRLHEAQALLREAEKLEPHNKEVGRGGWAGSVHVCARTCVSVLAMPLNLQVHSLIQQAQAQERSSGAGPSGRQHYGPSPQPRCGRLSMGMGRKDPLPLVPKQ